MKIIDDTKPGSGHYLFATSAIYVDGYRLRIAFSDGTSRVVDFREFLSAAPQPWIRQYLDLGKFKKFSVENGNVNWNDYELIFPITDLYSGRVQYEKADRKLLDSKPARRVPRTHASSSKLRGAKMLKSSRV